MLMNVLDYMDNVADKHPDETAFIDGENIVTFEEFRQLVLIRAFGILCRLNQKQAGHRPIVLMQQKGIDELVNFWAMAYTGNNYVPFDMESPDERLKKMISTEKVNDEVVRILNDIDPEIIKYQGGQSN